MLYFENSGEENTEATLRAVREWASKINIRDIIIATTNMRKINSWRRINVNPIPAMSVFLTPPSRIEARLHRSVN